MGRLYLIQLDGRIYSCKNCNSHLANSSDLLAKQTFHCRHGKAYLFNTVVNVSLGQLEERTMTTGRHTVADIYCNCCRKVVGWKYEAAHEENQKYKEGKFILELTKMIDGSGSSNSELFLDLPAASSGSEDD